MSRTALGVLCAVLLGAAPLVQAQIASTTTVELPSNPIRSTAETGSIIATSSETGKGTTAFDPYNPQDVEARVRSYFVDIPVMIAIARCESGFEQYDATGHPLYGGTGGMVGVFQEAAVIHGPAARAMGLDINTLDGNMAYARYLYEQEGVVPWLSSASCWNPSMLKSNLRLGSEGNQVTELQRLLNRNGFSVAQSGPGSSGEETNVFGPMTRLAVRRFQCAMDIVCSGSESTTGFGAVGPSTRIALLHADAKNTVDSSALSQR